MNESKIAVRYSKALFLSATERDLVEKVRADMKYILELSYIQDFRDVIDSPVIENSKKRDIMEALLKGKVSDITYNLVLLSVANNRESFLAGIARCYIDLADREKGITKASLITTTILGETNRAAMINLIEKDMTTKVDLQEIIDPEIGGGFVLKIEDLYVDGSVRSQLRKIRTELIEE